MKRVEYKGRQRTLKQKQSLGSCSKYFFYERQVKYNRGKERSEGVLQEREKDRV